MTTASAPNPRASLLAGLRTGGVRSTSSSIPQTAAPGATFNIPRFASQNHSSSFPEDEEDQLADIPQQSVFAGHHSGNRAMPMTAAVDGPNNRFSQQQMGQRGMNPHSVPFSPAAFNPSMMAQSNQMQNQALQMQMLQLEMMRIQTIQAQQIQAEMMAQAQAQRQQQQAQLQSQQRRVSLGFNPPATAGPLSNTFDLRSAALSAQVRRANQAEQVHSQLSVGNEDQVPMTAALGGKFGSRTTSLNATGTMSRFAVEEYDNLPPPPTPGSTTVISGGTSLGNPASNNINKVASNVSSKSDSVTSWRRGGNNNSVLSGNNRAVSSPSVKVTPPPGESQRVSSPPAAAPSKFRPQPLRFSGAAAQPLPTVTIDTSEGNDNDNDDNSSSSSGASNSSPTTPRSSSSNETSLSPREEASKKLYEGLGIGRPASAVSDHQYPSVTSVATHRIVSQPKRQPRGPPSGADELGPKNFATRIRRKAIGGLGMLMGARERRELVEAY
ncbi:hypothetical protein Hypma_009569 [Hypsizygus marmoreus]|uniref:Uncharacterized protein n=1 Tax=Hypsizygus marmoreus TaxID=39966 RepID=A0A369JMY2_HYPMA|nr:hypothetical protein Hypma_009569 [Hypsizygus marmoreus]